MNKEQMHQASDDFFGNFDCRNNEEAKEASIKFLQSMIDKGEIMYADEYKGFTDNYKAEADTNALSCAVADAEEEHFKIRASNERHIANLEKQIATYVRLVDWFIDNNTENLSTSEECHLKLEVMTHTPGEDDDRPI